MRKAGSWCWELRTPEGTLVLHSSLQGAHKSLSQERSCLAPALHPGPAPTAPTQEISTLRTPGDNSHEKLIDVT